MRMAKRIAEIATRPLRVADRLQATSQKWAQEFDRYHQQALELGRIFLSGAQVDAPQAPVIELGQKKSWQKRVVAMLVSFCAAALLVGGVGGFFLFLLNFCLLLILISKGLGLRVHLPDVFQTP